MKIVKHKKSNFTILSNKILFNRTLSMREKGLLAVMFGLPDDWRFSIRGLATLNEDGVDGTASTLKSLEKKGFLKRERTFYKNGQFCGIDYHIYEESQNVDTFTSEPCTGNPDTVEGSLLNTNILSTNILNTKKERNTRAHAYVNKSTNFEIEKELEKSKNFEKHLENLKNKYSKVQATKEPEQLKEVYPNCAQTQVEQNSKPIDESNSQLKEVSPDCTNNQENNDLVSKYSEIFDFELKSKYQNSHINHRVKENQTQYENNTKSEKISTHQYCGQDVNGKSKSCSKSMQMYGRESFDEITTRRISNTEERVKLGKYLAFIIKRFGNITNDLWNTFLDRYLSLSNVLEKRLANLDYSFSGGYSNIFPAPKNEFRSRIQYADISIFE